MNKLFCGIDLGTRSSSFCVIDENKKVVRRYDGANSKLVRELRSYSGRLHCVVEASPLAESVCQAVEKLGSTIEIVDSRHTRALLHGKKKTDRIDAETLAAVAHMGWYKPIFRKDGKCRQQRTILKSRAIVVSSATRAKNTIRGLLKANGIVLPAGTDGKIFEDNTRKAIEALSADVQRAILDLLEIWKLAEGLQNQAYKRLERIAKKDPVGRRLMTVPGVGPATAVGFSATIAAHTRFKTAKKVAGYLGLAPVVHQSGDTHYHGKITKKGDKLMRWLLIEAAGVMLTRVKATFALKTWGLALAVKKGHAKAKVAVARRLAALLFTLWKKEKDFVAQPA